MKKCLLLLLLPFLLLPAFARGVMSGEENLRVVKTEWFDIIFPQRSEAQAQFLAGHADRIYQEIAADYGMPPQFRMPVVITPAVEQHNAYFSQAFYNHIVLYAAQPSPELDLFSDSLLSTFAHELTHAYTYNMKNGFWKAVGTVFGDTVNPGHLLITRGWAEGATLTMESSQGEGRLNSGYSLQMVRQAAIEGAFPSYADVQGARNSYPAGSFYNFNGGFNQWLQDSYGMENYAEFWYTCINLKAITVGQAFKKVYGQKLSAAWRTWRQEIQGQWLHVEPNPLEARATSPCGVKDFFRPDSEDFSPKNTSGSRYSSLVSSSAGLAWIDDASSTIFWEDASSRKTHRLATIQGIQSITLSSDGRFLTATVLSQGSGAPKLQLHVYDRKEHRRHKLSVAGRDSGTVVAIGRAEPGTAAAAPESAGAKATDYLLLSTEYENSGSRFYVERLVLEGKKLALESLYRSPLEKDTYYRDFVALDSGNIACIQSKNGRQAILLFQTEALAQARFRASPKSVAPVQEIHVSGLELGGKPLGKLELRNLSSAAPGTNPQTGGAGLLFSWAAKDTLPRLGFWDEATGKIHLQARDISGGVHHPVATLGGAPSGSTNLAFVGMFYTENRLLRGNVTGMALEEARREQVSAHVEGQPAADQREAQAAAIGAAVPQAHRSLGSAGKQAEGEASDWDGLQAGDKDGEAPMRAETQSLPSQKYWPLSSYTQGVFLPLAWNLSLPYYGNPNRAGIALPVGLTWMTSNPWLMGVMVASAGYGIDTKSVAYNLSYQNGTATPLFQYQLSHGSEFDMTGDGWLQSTVTAAVGSTVPVGAVSRLTLANTGRLQFGQVHLAAADSSRSTATASSQAPGTGLPQAEGFYFHLINSASASWSNLRQWGPGPYQQLGLSVGAEVYYTMNLDLGRKNLNQNTGNMGVAASLHLPQLLPFDCVQNHTYNLPTVLTLRLFPSSLATASGLGANLFSYSWGRAPTLAAMVEAETVLYSVNIQKALPLVTALYANDFSLSVRGTVGFEDRLHSADTAASSLGWSKSWRLFKLDEYFSQLGSSRVPVAANIAVRAALNLSPNIGFSAHPNLGGALYFEFTTEGLTKPFVPVFTLGLTSRL